MYSSLLIQSILEFFSCNQDISSMTSYLIELRTSNVNFCESSSIMTSIWTWSAIHSDSLLIIYICIGFSACWALVLAFLSLIAKYSCWLLLSLPLLEEVYLIQLEHQPISYGSCCSSETLKASCSLVSLRKLVVFWLYCVACSSSEILKSFRFYFLYDQLYVFLAVFLNILFWMQAQFVLIIFSLNLVLKCFHFLQKLRWHVVFWKDSTTITWCWVPCE